MTSIKKDKYAKLMESIVKAKDEEVSQLYVKIFYKPIIIKSVSVGISIYKILVKIEYNVKN